MNILIVNWRDVTHPWAGGAERHLHELAKRWASASHTVTLLAGGYPGAVPEETIERVRIIRRGTTYTIFLVAWWFALRLNGNGRFDCIVETAHGLPFFLRIFFRNRLILVIHHNHRDLWRTEWHPVIAGIGNFLEQHIVPFLYRDTDIITLSDSTASELMQLGFRSVTAIPPGVDPPRRISQRKFIRPTIVYVGRLRKYKRVELLLKMFARIRRSIPAAELLIAGTGQDRAYLEFYARINRLDTGVRFLGYVSEDEKVILFSGAWVLAFPSLIEGWGLVALEAAAYGTPTVAFRVHGLADAVGNGRSGFLAESETEFVSAVIRILREPRLRQELNRSSRIWARRFSWKTSAERFLSVMTRQPYRAGYFGSVWRKGLAESFHPVHEFRCRYLTETVKAGSVLDIGCGTGRLVGLLRTRDVRAFGCDISPEAVRQAPENIRQYLYLADITRMNRRGIYDAVACTDVLEHIPLSDMTRAVLNCARHARQTVFFDITCREDFLFIYSDATHVTKLFSWQWHRLLSGILGGRWQVSRAYILPFIHHATFVAVKNTAGSG